MTISVSRRGAAPAGADARSLVPVSMEEAVGYPAIDCSHEASVENPIVLKHDHLFLLLDQHGDIAPPGHCALGLFHDDTRLLSHYRLHAAGEPMSLLSMQRLRPYSAQIDLAVADRAFGGDAWDPKNCVHLRRLLVLEDRLVERLTLTSYLRAPVDYWVELSLGADFADIFEVRGWKRPARGQFYAPELAPDTLAFAYRGQDGRLLRSVVHFFTPPTALGPRGARWELRLEPHTRYELEWEVLPAAEETDGATDGGRIVVAQAREAREAESAGRWARLDREYDGWRAECARWTTDVEAFNATLDQAVDDLRALYVHVDGAPVISAGIPWYSTAFGRDSIITSLETLALNPRIARDTLRYLARYQGRTEDPYTEEQPGKIMHEVRRGELARAGEIPHVPYYGTIDATPLWLVLLHETWRWTGDLELVRELLPNAERALAWIDRYGDMDGDGLVEYARTSAKGLVNQGWKDSGDGVPFPDGTLPEPPIALVEVQGYVHDAKRRAAMLYEAVGDRERARQLCAEAARLREAIVHRFWLDDLGTFALALDGRKRPLPTVTSNAGHLLWSRVPDAEQAIRMAAGLMAPDMFSGWGIRTLSAMHPVFNPMSYHNGSIWPHDNALLVMGLSHYRQVRAALPVITVMHEAAAQLDPPRLPELFCGMTRMRGLRPVQYPVSCSPQAWASGAMFLFLQAALGLLPHASEHVLHVRDPQLPPFLQELTLDGLAVGDARLTLQFRRQGGRTLANLLALEGEPLQVRIELS
ncbi:MAG TPA: glycogen debranching N-terminal domain-containing protein [Gemmatimonadaceae bacterium]|nr:glycogen debranching N-terminal domain-containing protein [Gemmatimonadaceae bacterium]